MRGDSMAARLCVSAAVLAALGSITPGLLAGQVVLTGARGTTLAALLLLYLGCEHLWRVLPNASPPGSSFFPVLLASAILLPPAAAALIAVPGALSGRVEERPAGLRRIWHAAQLSLATFAAGHVCMLVCSGRSLTAPQFPFLLLPALALGIAFCLVLTTLDTLILYAIERRPPLSGLLRLKSSIGPLLLHGLVGLLMAVLWRSSYGPVSALLVLLPMYISCWVFAQYHRERAAHQATIRALVQAVDIKDRYTRGHSERVGRASVLIARELGMPEERLEVLRIAGILHDVGKLGVPTRILRKDGPLTDAERRIIQLHPEYGHEIVRGIGFLEEARAAILHHHERLDGGGYPYGLAGAEIPESARVVAVADAFDAMTSNRSYQRARAVPVALEELRKHAGLQFDPRMVRALVRGIERYGWHVAVTSDEPGVRALPGPAPQGTNVTAEAAPKPAAIPAPGRSRR